MKILIINGPNLNLLGNREPDIYGNDSLRDIKQWVESQTESQTIDLEWFQSNHEGKIIDKIHNSINKKNGIIINAGGLTHYSYSLRDAISSINIPTVEVHLSDINKRESFRKKSVIKDVCINQISGKGKHGYLLAIKCLIDKFK
tara:strand:- start:2129 stop:2560 length:432 start_codon:yes stop_codon:yes gene_type:complete